MKYKEAAIVESSGIYGSLGIKIMISTNRELNENDTDMLYEKCEEIEKALDLERDKNDPELKAEIEEERRDIIALFPNPIFVEEIPNGYSDEMINPWFIVITNKGRIKIGWRKSVINIDWSDSIIAEEADDLFPKEDVTKDDKHIHAHGYEKAKEYVDVLLASKKELANPPKGEIHERD